MGEFRVLPSVFIPPGQQDGALAVVTMGGQAQVVTFCLDALLAREEGLRGVLVLHPAAQDERVARALAQLAQEFRGGQYQGRTLAFYHRSLQAGKQPLEAITSEAEAEATWHLAQALVLELKQRGLKLHVCVAGGPRLMALMLVSAMMLHGEHRDRVWHLYTPREFLAQAREGAILHAPPEAGVKLVPVPITPLGTCFPAVRQLAQVAPRAVAAVDEAEAQRCVAVWERLSSAQQEVLRLLAEGATPQQVAQVLNLSPKTVDWHKTHILTVCREVWNVPPEKRLTYHFLREHFGSWVRLMLG